MDLGDIKPGEMIVTVPLRDKDGIPLANGLYYLEARTSAGQAVGKILILR
jgi:hypothetical protein